MVKFYDENYLAAKLGTDRRTFHRIIKPTIINDFKSRLNKLRVKNPDIGLDQKDRIVLADPKNHTRRIETKLSINEYFCDNEE